MTSGTSSLDIDDVRVETKEGLPKWWKKVLVIVVGCVIVVALIAIVVVAVMNSVEDDKNDEPDPDSPIPEVELMRIDCYPEAGGGVEEATEEACLARGCTWQVSEYDDVPPCFVPQSNEFGFRVVSGPVDTALGYRWVLAPLNSFAIYGENFADVMFDVEFRKDHLLRFKVNCCVTIVNFHPTIYMYTYRNIQPRIECCDTIYEGIHCSLEVFTQ